MISSTEMAKARVLSVDPETTFFVLDKHTLGYVKNADPTWFGVLGRDIHGYDWRDGPITLTPQHQLRAATRKDFDTFRVSIDYHLRDPNVA